jgi:uncharacterized protein YbjQ (UPF0145 family)
MQGTAVRARSAVRPSSPFTSHLSAQDFARLLRAGWVPATLVYGIALGARHDDLRTRRQTKLTATGEVRGYSHVVRDTRHDARRQLEQAVAEAGADGVLADRMTLHLGERECPTYEGMHDHVAEVVLLGTAIVSFARSRENGAGPPLSVLHLNSSSTPARDPRQAAAGPDWTQSESEGRFLDRAWSAWAARRASRGIIAQSDAAGITRKAD